MKFFKTIITSMLALMFIISVPAGFVFADENGDYPIMPVGITKPFSKSASDYSTYKDGTSGYYIQYSVSGTYYHGVDSSSNAFAKDVSISSCTSGLNDNIGPQDGTYNAKIVNTNYYTSKLGYKVAIVISVRVKETIKGSAYYSNHQHTFYLPWLKESTNQYSIDLNKHHYF